MCRGSCVGNSGVDMSSGRYVPEKTYGSGMSSGTAGHR